MLVEFWKEAEIEHQAIVDLWTDLKFNKIVLIGENFFKTTHLNLMNTNKYSSFQDFKTQFNPSEINNSTVLIKGSRGMALERVLELL